MSERSKETVLKTVVVQATASSNLALSAWEGPGRNPGALFVCREYMSGGLWVWLAYPVAYGSVTSRMRVTLRCGGSHIETPDEDS